MCCEQETETLGYEDEVHGVHMNIKNSLKRIGRRLTVLMLTGIMLVSVVGCGSGKSGGSTITPGSSILPAPKKPVTDAPAKNANEIEITGVLTDVNTSDLKMHFMDIDTGTEYEVAYTGGTDIQSKYGTIIAASNMKPGEIYDITCDKSGRALNIHGNDRAWERSGITGLSFDESTKNITIGATTLTYNSSTVILSNSDRISIAQLVSQDEVTLRGIDKTVYSVNVDKGHGYITFTGVDSFLGGYVSLGRQQLLGVTSGMLATAQEGTVTVEMQLGSLMAAKTVTVARDEQISVDFSEYATAASKSGAVNFMVTPNNAVMEIDGAEVDYSKPVSLKYGTHKLVLKVNHYEEYTETFTVNSPYQTKVIDMVSSGSTKASTKAGTTAADQTNGYTVNVTAPEGAALYVDSMYIGIIPCTFNKTAGNKTITLTRTGFSTVSYTIAIANASGNLTYAFPEMAKAEEK